MYLPHQIVGHMLNERFDKDIRRHFFKGMEFAAPVADPGWFGPGSAVWHVHSHMHALIFGLQCAAYIERLDPSIYWMGMHHSRLVKRDDDGTAIPVIDPKGAVVRLGHSVAFFIGTAYGSTETAERLAQSVRAMHHTIKGTRPDGAALRRRRPGVAALELCDGRMGHCHRARAVSPESVARQEDRRVLRRVRAGRACAGRH